MADFLKNLSVVFFCIAVFCFLFAMMGMISGMKESELLSWDAPMPWALVFAIAALAAIIAAKTAKKQ